jgi:diguanylate cyclase (GGDEF)-like protein/hemerythrin-like metal-binding protein/PAS domain S-box-containing protein
MCGVSTDITELKRSANKLREISEELQESQSIAGLGTYMLDIGTGVWKSSPVLDHIFGIDESFPRTVKGWESIIHVDDRVMMHDYFLSEVIANRQPFEKDYRIVRISDDAVSWVHGKGKLDFDVHGHPIKMHGTIQDISARKLAEDISKQNEILLSCTLESTDEGILMISPDGRVLSANKRFKELWRIPQAISDSGRDDLLLKHVLDQLVDANEFLSLVKRLYESDEEARDILNFKDGRVFARYTQSLYIGNSKGRIWCFRDITDYKKIENELREKEERLALAARYNGVGIWDWNLVTQQMVWDDSMYALYQIKREDFIGTEAAWRAALHPDDLEHGDREVEAAIRGDRPFDTEFRVVWPNGEIRYIKAVAKVLRDEHGKAVRMLGTNVDISQRKVFEHNLRKESEKNIALLRNASDGIHILDTNGHIIEASDSFCLMLGYSREEVIGMHVTQWDSALSGSELTNVIAKQLCSKTRSQFETRHRRKDGTEFDVEVSGNPVQLWGKQVLFNSSRDITDRKLTEKRLSITASVFDISQEAIAITDADNNIIDINPAFTKITGFSREEVIGKNPNILSSGRQSKDFYVNLWKALNEKGIWRGEIWNRKKSGQIYPEMLSISVLKENTGKVLTHVAMFSDISNLKQHEDELIRVAHFDALTNIPNRILLADRMKQGISQTSRDQNMMAICYLDLDGFKPINDKLGHQVGDDVLIEMARRIGVTIRGGDTVARLGGDEFVILLLGLSKGEECVTTIERLLEAIATPIAVKNKTVSVTASIGVSIYPLDEEDPDTLLRHADQAMYIAKQSGKNRFHIYDVNLDKRARNQNDFLKSIRVALEQNQFELHYQPKVNLRTKDLVGAEALIRWRHPERGLLSPAEFLRQVENTDLDIQIGEWVTSTALEQIQLWRSAGLDIEVSINISGYHLESRDFVSKLQRQLANYATLPFGKLQIEVLETIALNDVAAVQGIIESCRKFGVGFALDDFGTGYSSLSYLSALPVDTLKIDQSFVRDMLEDKGDMAIVQGIIALARAFERQTVAEGIETEEHNQALLDMGCEFGQGYLFSKPVPRDQFEVILKRERNKIRTVDKSSVILRLNWQVSYECGENTIDQEHHKLLDLANTLIEFAFTRNEDPKGFESAMDELLAHVVKHFADEEAILAQHNYTELDDHKDAHKLLIDQALRLRNSTNIDDETIGVWVNFIADKVIAHHMLKEDRKFYSLFKKDGNLITAS